MDSGSASFVWVTSYQEGRRVAPSVSVTSFSEEGKEGELLCVVMVFKVHMLELSIIWEIYFTVCPLYVTDLSSSTQIQHHPYIKIDFPNNR